MYFTVEETGVKFLLPLGDSLHTYIYVFTDPSSTQVGLNAEFTMKRAKLQYAVSSNH